MVNDIYKCPNCGADISFDANSQKLKCPYCDTEIDINTLVEYENIKKEDNDHFGWEEVDLSDILSKDEADLNQYICQNCGGDIICDETTSTTICPYCGGNIIIKKQFEGMLRPKYLIPFKYDLNSAKNAFYEHFKNKVLVPKDFKSLHKLDKLVGIYVPYWLFDAKAKGGVRYRATRIRTYTMGDYNYTETMHFLLIRDGDMTFKKVPVDASLKFDDNLLEALEPYDFKETVDFNTAYLQGYLSDRFEEMADDVKTRANERMKNSLINELNKTTIGYATVVCENAHLSFDDGEVNYGLLPIYVMHASYKGKDYIFAMNGQTGKFVGDLPCDYPRLILFILLTFIISFGLMFALTYFLL